MKTKIVITFFFFLFSLMNIQKAISQNELEKDTELIEKFVKGKMYYSAFQFTYRFFNSIKNNNLETFLKEGKYNSDFEKANKELVEKYDSIRYYLRNCPEIDTSSNISFIEEYNNERVFKLRILIKHGCPDKIHRFMKYNSALEFTITKDEKLLLIKPEFEKYILDEDNLPAFPKFP